MEALQGEDEGKIFVGGLNWETTDDGLKNYFARYGEVIECMIMRDPVTRRSRGFGFLSFRDPAVTDKIVAEKHTLDGKMIDPKKAIPKDEQRKQKQQRLRKVKQIFVGGIAMHSTDDTLKTYFSQFGTITDFAYMKTPTGKPRGFAYVTYDNEDVVEQICTRQYHEIDGKPDVEVKRAIPKEEQRKMNMGGHAHGGGYHGGYPTRGGGGYRGGYGQRGGGYQSYMPYSAPYGGYQQGPPSYGGYRGGYNQSSYAGYPEQGATDYYDSSASTAQPDYSDRSYSGYNNQYNQPASGGYGGRSQRYQPYGRNN